MRRNFGTANYLWQEPVCKEHCTPQDPIEAAEVVLASIPTRRTRNLKQKPALVLPGQEFVDAPKRKH